MKRFWPRLRAHTLPPASRSCTVLSRTNRRPLPPVYVRSRRQGDHGQPALAGAQLAARQLNCESVFRRVLSYGRERNNARAAFLGPRRSVQPGNSLPSRLASRRPCASRQARAAPGAVCFAARRARPEQPPGSGTCRLVLGPSILALQQKRSRRRRARRRVADNPAQRSASRARRDRVRARHEGGVRELRFSNGRPGTPIGGPVKAAHGRPSHPFWRASPVSIETAVSILSVALTVPLFHYLA